MSFGMGLDCPLELLEFTDHFVLFFQLVDFLATVNGIKLKVWRWCGIVREERSPKREMTLRLSDSFPVTATHVPHHMAVFAFCEL